MIFVGGMVLIGIGVLSLVAPDVIWSWQKVENQWEGRASERSDLWEIRRVAGGIAGIALGVLAIIVGIASS